MYYMGVLAARFSQASCNRPVCNKLRANVVAHPWSIVWSIGVNLYNKHASVCVPAT